MPTQSNELLPEICILPPPLGREWVGAGTTQITETPAGQRPDPWPLFWYDPPWHDIPAEAARQIASALDAMHIRVTVLGGDLGLDDLAAAELRHALIPYRPDRYGLVVEDIHAAAAIDLRLARARDEMGRYAYSPAQMQRWLGRDRDEEEDITAAIPAPGWPADLSGPAALKGKWHQLRTLNPQATCAVSIGPYRLLDELPAVVASGPDAVILRMDESDEMVGSHLARVVARAKTIIDKAANPSSKPVQLWLVLPYEPTATDCVKLMALGASVIAIDWWCQPLIRSALELTARAGSMSPRALAEQAQSLLKPRMNRFAGLISSCDLTHPRDLQRAHLATTDHVLAKQIGLTAV